MAADTFTAIALGVGNGFPDGDTANKAQLLHAHKSALPTIQ